MGTVSLIISAGTIEYTPRSLTVSKLGMLPQMIGASWSIVHQYPLDFESYYFSWRGTRPTKKTGRLRFKWDQLWTIFYLWRISKINIWGLEPGPLAGSFLFGSVGPVAGATAFLVTKEEYHWPPNWTRRCIDSRHFPPYVHDFAPIICYYVPPF